MGTFTVLGIITPTQLLLAAVIPGAATVNPVNSDEPHARPWHRVITAPSFRHAEVAARFLHAYDVVLHMVTAGELVLDCVVVDAFGTARRVIALRREGHQVHVWFDTNQDFASDGKVCDCTYRLDTALLVLPAEVPIPLDC